MDNPIPPDPSAASFLLEILKLLLSWPVVTLVILFAAREQILAMLAPLIKSMGDRLTKASVGSAAFEFEAPKTAATAVGKTNVSAIPTRFETDSCSFRSLRFGFEISYPVSWEVNVTADEGPEFRPLAEAGNIVAVWVRTPAKFNDFQPNVNVMAQPIGDTTVTQYMALSIQKMVAANAKLLAYDVDPKTNGASCSYRSVIEGTVLHHVARVSLARGFAFVATTTTVADAPLPESVRDQLNAVLNSFHVLNLHPEPAA